MEKLKLMPLDISKLHHAEFGQFIIRFYEDFSKTSIDLEEDKDFETMFNGLQSQIPTYNLALDQIRANEESGKIATLDKERDADMQALKDSIKPYRNTKSETEKDAYISIKIVLDQFKDVENNSYEEETNRLNLLITKLQSAEYAPSVTELGILKFVNNLATSNTAFNDLFAHRSFQNSQKVTYDVKSLRKTMTADYQKLANYIVALANVKSDAFYQDILELLNNGRKYFSDVLARRTTKKLPPENPINTNE